MTRCAYVFNVDTCNAEESDHGRGAHDFVRPEDGFYARLHARILFLERQVADLQAANTREVMRRRHAEGECDCTTETLCEWARGRA